MFGSVFAITDIMGRPRPQDGCLDRQFTIDLTKCTRFTRGGTEVPG